MHLRLNIANNGKYNMINSLGKKMMAWEELELNGIKGMSDLLLRH